ncbi:hypothetical protein NDU88_004062 [Pleurodeles waltl]|uniref:Uncharacterized protein n=1 Tax=Pleurodeles waltl TaxID=8319 RepID=A0AAV7TQU2_PLEWA|nr:hypothetical protein NDU88_004062 [Pleurodeles waltl]
MAGAETSRKRQRSEPEGSKGSRRRGVYDRRESPRTGTQNPHGPNPGRRPPAPGSIRLGPAMLQEKRGQARYGARDG